MDYEANKGGEQRANLLLLSMSLYNRDLSEHYYTADGELFFFCGVSQLEAGTKYFLRKLQKKNTKLDKIIVIESQEVRDEKRDVSRWFKEGNDNHLA
ncbi:MAG: hypothetical protein LIO96_04845 [Lachnospiraceae bacterium]|nr:hypothetical protein [Lachnospiraceae bacterium]